MRSTTTEDEEPGASSNPANPQGRSRPLLDRPGGHVLAAVGTYAVIGVMLSLLGLLALRVFGVAHPRGGEVAQSLIDAWNRWDAGWYQRIATDGYSYASGKQSAVAFFPAYPMLMRAARHVVHVSVAGVVITIASGAAGIALYAAWTRRFLDQRTTLLAVAVLLLYPYAFYLYGAVYSDAFFLAAALASFVLLESRRPWWSAMSGFVAGAARPVGIALALGLALRSLELRRGRGSGDRRHPLSLTTFAPALLTLAGLGAYMLFLWHRFKAPLAFANTEAGWNQSPGPATWFKVSFIDHMLAGNAWNVFRYIGHLAATVFACALVPVVWRRFGRAYGVYALAALLLPALSTSDFFSMGRYVLAAFPCFAALATLLSTRRLAMRLELVMSGSMLMVLSVMFNRGYYIS